METVVETRAYLSAAKDAGMSDEEREIAVNLISANPEAGELMVGTGGCRKIRFAGKGRGKSGGYRLISFYRTGGRVFLLTVFAKGDRANLTQGERNGLKALTALL